MEWIETHQNDFTNLSDRVWEFAEVGYKEVRSSQLLIQALEEGGFRVEKGAAAIPTAFIASYTKGAGPIIGILGEFDALPGLSQDCVPYRKPLVNGAPGHGCGHNLLGVAGIAACFALKQALDADEAKGTVRYYGCPADPYNGRSALDAVELMNVGVNYLREHIDPDAARALCDHQRRRDCAERCPSRGGFFI